MATPDCNPFDTQIAADALDQASECVGMAFAQTFRECDHVRRPLNSLIESPIEAAFWIWWRALHNIDEMLRVGHSLDLQPQVDVETSDGSRYRLDFAVVEYRVAIELDGHDFHERTKEQVAHRNTRDRKLQADGWTVLHISGSEMFRDPLNSVEAVYSICCEKVKESWRAAIKKTIDQMPKPAPKPADEMVF